MRTVFVIGAGANVEIGMPSGIELKKEIAECLNFEPISRGEETDNRIIFNALHAVLRNDIEQVFGLASTIKEAMPFSISIDNFIDAHRNEPLIALCGKLAIIKSILAAERRSAVFHYFKNNNERFLDSWYPLFFQKITEGCEINQFVERINDISLIIFNYDRCFEYYMSNAINVYYKIGNAKSNKIVNEMKIIHPYGKIGDLSNVPLDAALYYNELLDCTRNIRTFTENSEEVKKERTAIKQLIDRANRIIFLGFAYHSMNLNLLFKNSEYTNDIDDSLPHSDFVNCYGTGYKIHEKDRTDIQNRLSGIDRRILNCDIADVTCTKFFNDFWYRISFQDT